MPWNSTLLVFRHRAGVAMFTAVLTAAALALPGGLLSAARGSSGLQEADPDAVVSPPDGTSVSESLAAILRDTELFAEQ